MRKVGVGVLLVLVAALAYATLAERAGEPALAPADVPAGQRAALPERCAVELGPVVEASTSCRAAITRADPEQSAELAADRAALVEAIAELDHPGASVTELQDLGRTLTQLLRERPELGAAAVAAIARGRTREVLFQLRRAVRAVVDQPAVRSRLLELAAAGEDARREAAIQALGGLGDADALALFGDVLADPGTGDLARSAAAFELGRDIEAAPPATRARAITAARSLATSASSRLKAEALDLLGRAGLDVGDRSEARRALADPSDEVALAAARALLQAGEPRDQVARALRARADDPLIATVLDGLEGK